MKKGILMAMVAVVVLASGAVAAESGRAGLVEYRVISEMPVSLEEVVGLFMPGLLPSGKIEPLLTRDNKGLEVIHRWNPHLAVATWKTGLQPGTIIWLSDRWTQWGPQYVLERVCVPMVLPSGATQTEGERFWMLNFFMLLCAAGVCAIYLYSRSWGK